MSRQTEERIVIHRARQITRRRRRRGRAAKEMRKITRDHRSFGEKVAKESKR